MNIHPVDKYIGEAIKVHRKKIGISQLHLSKVIGKSRQQFEKYESGESKLPVSLLCEICRELNIELAYFLEQIESFSAVNKPNYSKIPQARLTPLKILIVEDNPAEAVLTKEAIGYSGYETEMNFAVNGAEALSFLKMQGARKNIPDVIFLDLNMPKVNGVDVLTAIKKDRSLMYIPIVVITNSSDLDEMRQTYQLGANGYIVKDFNPDNFFEVIRVAVEYWYKMALPSL